MGLQKECSSFKQNRTAIFIVSDCHVMLLEDGNGITKGVLQFEPKLDNKLLGFLCK